MDLELGIDLGCAWIWAVRWMGKKEGVAPARDALLDVGRSTSDPDRPLGGRPLRLDCCSV
jgi:hypothetical protein